MTTFAEFLTRHSWICDEERPCVVSPDIDGLLCALLMGHARKWRCLGFYDGDRLCLYENPRRIPWDEAVFIDVEVLRPDVRSIGNHLLSYDAEDARTLEATYPGLANPNHWRGIHFEPDFQRKYPFGTLPLLVCALALRKLVEIERRHLGPLYYADSGLENAVVYKDNALDWLRAMGAEDPKSPLAPLCNVIRRRTIFEGLKALAEVQSMVSKAGFGKMQKAARFDPENEAARKKAQALAGFLTDLTGWKANLPLDAAPALILSFRTKRLPLDAKGRAKASFEKVRRERALSLAATGRTDEGLSYTIPPPKTEKFADLWR